MIFDFRFDTSKIKNLCSIFNIQLNMHLCIDTTTQVAGITLVDACPEGDIDQCRLQGMQASEGILGAVDQLIKKTDIQLSDLKGVLAIKGPGSFTGLRVGIAVANQFAHQLNIPIIGLRTEEWWQYRTNKKDFVYLQTMNREEVYIVGFGKLSDVCSDNILPFSDLQNFDLSIEWLGELSNSHREQLPDKFKEITDLHSPEQTWLKVGTGLHPISTSSFIEPFYGKEPMITKSKRKLSI